MNVKRKQQIEGRNEEINQNDGIATGNWMAGGMTHGGRYGADMRGCLRQHTPNLAEKKVCHVSDTANLRCFPACLLVAIQSSFISSKTTSIWLLSSPPTNEPVNFAKQHSTMQL